MRTISNCLVAVLFVLLLCIYVQCDTYDDAPTIKKARCYANCITLVSKIPLNDSSCQSSQCLECKSPCDRNFDSVETCSRICPNSSHYCNQSCNFLQAMNIWTNLSQGNGYRIGEPGVVNNTYNNVTTLTLSWKPSTSVNGTVVYLLKERITGDRIIALKPLKGLVFLDTKVVITAVDACSIFGRKRNNGLVHKWNGLHFYFTVVALTEDSMVVEGLPSSAINFTKAAPVTISNPLATYDPMMLGDKLKFQVSFTPPPGLPNNTITNYAMVVKKTGGECDTLNVEYKSSKWISNNISSVFSDNTASCNLSVTVYSEIQCLPSEPNQPPLAYIYSCRNALNFNQSVCCQIDPTREPVSEWFVRNLTYSPIKTTDDYRFNTTISWLSPNHTCLKVKNYGIAIYDKDNKIFFNIPLPTRKTTTDNFWKLENMKQNQQVKVEVTPNFVKLGGKTFTGKASHVVFTLPDVPLNETSILNIYRHIQWPSSPSDRFSVNISWDKPGFKYSKIEKYNVTYTVQGDVTKYNLTQQLWYVFSGLDYAQSVSFQVVPVYRHSWIKTNVTRGSVSLPVLKESQLSIQHFHKINDKNFVKTKNGYTLSIGWDPPIFNRTVVLYEVTYTLTGHLDDELDCPSKSSSKRKCQTTRTTTTNYTLRNILPKERIEITVKPVFENTKSFQGKPKTTTFYAPGVVSAHSPGWSALQVAVLIVGILALLAIIVLLVVLYFRWKKQKDIKHGKLVDRNKGIVIDHWEVSHNNLELVEVIGEGAFGKVYKGLLIELPEQASRTGSSSMSFARRSIRSTRSSRPDDSYFVAVKMLHDAADEEQRKEFLKEIQLMKDVGSHRNIVNMLGCGTFSEPMFLIVEYLPNGDLLHYLRKRRGKAKQYPESDSRGPNHSTYCQTYFNFNTARGEPKLEPSNKSLYVNTNVNNGFQNESEDGIQLVSVKKTIENESTPVYNFFSLEDDLDDETITSGDLMAFAWQVAQGMEYLSKRGYVHRDLAARNVLVGNSKEAKIADFGLTRHMYEDLYRAKTNRRLPLKWMSIEAIFDQIFTSQSDVWSFGVLLWEIVTLGGTPYPAKTNRELLNFLKQGHRLEKPDTCDHEVYGIMMNCWKENPDERLTFIQIREKFEEMMMRENPYFDPSSVDESRDYYNVPSFNSIPDSDEGDDDVFNEILGNGKEMGKGIGNQPNGYANAENDEKLSEPEKHEHEFKEKGKFEPELDIGDIESLLYRKQHHSIKY